MAPQLQINLEMKKGVVNGWNNFRHANKGKDASDWRSLPPDQKEKYAGSPKQKDVNISCALSKFSNVVNKFKLDLCVELADSPFRFLLNLKGYNLDIDLIKKIVAGFNSEDKSFIVNDKELKPQKEDFEKILDLGKKEDYLKMVNDAPSTSTGFDETLFLVKKGTRKDTVCMKSVVDMLEKKSDVDNFKRAFALLCLRYIVCAPSNGKLGKKILRYVERVEDLRNQEWGDLALKYLEKGIQTYINSKAAGKKSLGGSMVFLQLYYHNKVENMKIEELIKDNIKLPVTFDDELVSAYEVVRTSMMTYGENHVTKLKSSRFGITSDLETDEDMGVKMRVKEDMDTDEDAHERMDMISVGPFNIRKILLSNDVCTYLQKFFREGEDSKILASVEDSDSFQITKKKFWDELSPKKELSNCLINYIADILSIRDRRISNGPPEKWYFPVSGRDHRIYSRRSQLKYHIKKEELTSVKKIFFPLGVEHGHWYLVVFNNEEKKVEIWDSFQKPSAKDYDPAIDNLCIFLRDTANDNIFKSYTRTLVPVPQQKNSFDCGVYACLFMEFPDKVMESHKEEWISEEQRSLLAIRILTAPENKPYIPPIRQYSHQMRGKNKQSGNKRLRTSEN